MNDNSEIERQLEKKAKRTGKVKIQGTTTGGGDSSGDEMTTD